jgi:hypothetical protein
MLDERQPLPRSDGERQAVLSAEAPAEAAPRT